jgi:uncharacterized membrane protein YhaH (DUF805 family)
VEGQVTREPRPVYLEDIYDPRGLVSKVYFRYLILLFVLSPIFVFLGIPVFFAIGRDEDSPQLSDDPAAKELIIKGYWIAAIILSYFLLVVCTNRLRMAGRSGFWLLVPGYNLYLLFTAEDRLDRRPDAGDLSPAEAGAKL